MARDRVRHCAADVTAMKVRELEALVYRWQRARQRYVAEYALPRYASQVVRSPRSMAEERRRRGWPRNGLSPHQNKVALLSALATIEGTWRSRFELVAERASSDAERRWRYYVLRWPRLMQACLDGGVVRLHKPWTGELDETLLSLRLRRALLRAARKAPDVKIGSWIELDTNLYRTFERPEDRHFRGAWIAITGLSRGRRLNLPLSGRGLDEFAPRPGRKGGPNIRLEIGDRPTIRLTEFVAGRATSGTRHAGLDKGYRTLLTVSHGDPNTSCGHGPSAAEFIGAVAERSAARLIERRRLAAYARSLRNSQKAKRIQRRNLGATRQRAASRRDKAGLRDQVNRALNTLFASHPDVGTFHVEALDFLGKKRTRVANRRLGRWLKGYLHERLVYKAGLNGVELNVVNAAYTSQCCPRCWFTSSRNRHAAQFKCRSCGFIGSADGVAATNVLKRGSDPAIARLTPATVVRQLLDARWRSARNGRAWGSNDGVGGDVPDVSREQLPEVAARAHGSHPVGCAGFEPATSAM